MSQPTHQRTNSKRITRIPNNQSQCGQLRLANKLPVLFPKNTTEKIYEELKRCIQEDANAALYETKQGKIKVNCICK